MAGESLKEILNNRVLGEMEKAMMLLVKKSASGAVDRARAGSSRPTHSISIEELDNNGNKVVENPKENVVEDGASEIVTRK